VLHSLTVTNKIKDKMVTIKIIKKVISNKKHNARILLVESEDDDKRKSPKGLKAAEYTGPE
jgi:hypothetical protein